MCIIPIAIETIQEGESSDSSTQAMANQENHTKIFRLLSIGDQLRAGKTLKKAELAKMFHVTEKSIQRDLEDLRCYFAEQSPPCEIPYDAKLGGYYLSRRDDAALSNSEILAVCKILLESRSMTKAEMLPLLDKLVTRCVPDENKKSVADLILNEKFHYIEPHHGQPLLPHLWEIGQAVQKHQVMEIAYIRMKDHKMVTRLIEPVGLMFSEYYFYLTAFLRNVDKATSFDNKDDIFPTIYRVDRIAEFKILNEHFRIPYANRFEEGEFRKRVQFMYGGKLEHIKFKFTGPSIEAVLDRLPTAEIVGQDEEGWFVQAEVFGKGINMWLQSQGPYITVCE